MTKCNSKNIRKKQCLYIYIDIYIFVTPNSCLSVNRVRSSTSFPQLIVPRPASGTTCWLPRQLKQQYIITLLILDHFYCCCCYFLFLFFYGFVSCIIIKKSHLTIWVTYKQVWNVFQKLKTKNVKWSKYLLCLSCNAVNTAALHSAIALHLVKYETCHQTSFTSSTGTRHVSSLSEWLIYKAAPEEPGGTISCSASVHRSPPSLEPWLAMTSPETVDIRGLKIQTHGLASRRDDSRMSNAIISRHPGVQSDQSAQQKEQEAHFRGRK